MGIGDKPSFSKVSIMASCRKTTQWGLATEELTLSSGELPFPSEDYPMGIGDLFPLYSSSTTRRVGRLPIGEWRLFARIVVLAIRNLSEDYP